MNSPGLFLPSIRGTQVQYLNKALQFMLICIGWPSSKNETQIQRNFFRTLQGGYWPQLDGVGFSWTGWYPENIQKSPINSRPSTSAQWLFDFGFANISMGFPGYAWVSFWPIFGQTDGKQTASLNFDTIFAKQGHGETPTNFFCRTDKQQQQHNDNKTQKKSH